MLRSYLKFAFAKGIQTKTLVDLITVIETGLPEYKKIKTEWVYEKNILGRII